MELWFRNLEEDESGVSSELGRFDPDGLKGSIVGIYIFLFFVIEDCVLKDPLKDQLRSDVAKGFTEFLRLASDVWTVRVSRHDCVRKWDLWNVGVLSFVRLLLPMTGLLLFCTKYRAGGAPRR